MFQLYNAARQTLELKKTPNSKHLKYLHLDTNVLKKASLLAFTGKSKVLRHVGRSAWPSKLFSIVHKCLACSDILGLWESICYLILTFFKIHYKIV